MSVNPYATATELLAALDRREVSSVDLTRMHIDRIGQIDGAINAVVVRDFERALAAAQAADDARAAGANNQLLGLPMTVKDGFFVDGLPATGGGIPERADEIADWDSAAVAAIKGAGGIIIGKTNMPPYAADHKSDNPLYGCTSNPWDLTRTPGGSSGGAAAALATGMTPLEIGGDYAGSIRVPSAFCGLFGHKSSETALPRSGHFPGGKHQNAAFAMAVQGPLARSAGDLELLFNLMSGPAAGEDIAWRLDLPAPRTERLADLRVALLPRFDWLPLNDEIAGAVEHWGARLAAAGATVATVDPFDGDFPAYFKTYLRILFSQAGAESPPEEAEAFRDEARQGDDQFVPTIAEAFAANVGDYLRWFAEREVYRERLAHFFRAWDILLAPCTLTNAFPHDELIEEHATRYVTVNGEPVRSVYMFPYPALCNLSGHPGTAFPSGQTAAGLPLGLQAIGPYLEDRTTLRFAALVEEAFGGFVPPVGYRT